MRLCTKYCGKIFPESCSPAITAWIAGNLLYPVQLDGRGRWRDEALISAGPADTLRAVFESLPSEGIADSRIELLDDNVAAWAARWRLLTSARENARDQLLHSRRRHLRHFLPGPSPAQGAAGSAGPDTARRDRHRTVPRNRGQRLSGCAGRRPRT